MSGIEWTDRTWNPVRGCSRVSEGCRNCYAEVIASRFGSVSGSPFNGFARDGKWTGRVELIEHRLRDPLSWRKPCRVFVNSMSDLFHEGLPDEAIDRVFAIMALAYQHTFQVLTKRPERMHEYLRGHAAGGRHIWRAAQQVEMPRGRNKPAPGWPLPNVWLGVSVENQAAADRILVLLQTPAAVRFISAEPLLALVGLSAWLDSIDWVIVGGESGPNARGCHLGWIRSIVQQCKAADVPVFVKQLGARPYSATQHVTIRDRKGGTMSEWPEDLRVREFPR